MLPGVVGWPALALGLLGCAAGLASARWRPEALFLVIWIAVLIAGLSLLPARDPRYILLLAPAFVVAAAIGVACAVLYLLPLDPAWQLGILAAGLAVGVWLAARIHVPQVSGFREIATYLQEQAPTDAVLYDGPYDGLFGFHVRALDSNFERRLALANKLLYESGPTNTFTWVQTSNVTSTDDVVNLLRTRSGCRWLAIEINRNRSLAPGQRLLRQAVERPEFEMVRSFAIAGAGERRVNLYRVVMRVEPVAGVDLRFPSLSYREFRLIVPIAR
jgi:hypothetical protein